MINQQEYIDKLIDGFSLMDDEFFAVAFDGRTKECSFLVNTILGRSDIKVTYAKTQYVIRNLGARSIELDMMATDQTGKLFNVEIQRDSSEAIPRRARFHASMMDAHATIKGTPFKNLPTTYIIFITEKDILKEDNSLYRIERVILDSGRVFDDGQHIIYVNAEVNDNERISTLMHDFMCTDHRKMKNEELAKLTDYFKNNQEGRRQMSDAVRQFGLELRAEGKEEGRREGKEYVVVKMLKKGLSAEEAAELSELPIERVRELAENL